MGVLKGLIISVVGDVGVGNEQLRKWIDVNGGRWVPRISKGVTHLICSKDAYKNNVDAVQQARKLNVFIISYDWLEDSLQSRRKLAERKYTWEVLSDQRRKQKRLRRLGKPADTKKFLTGCKRAHEDLGSGTCRKSTSRSKGGFFASALDDLKKKREQREAEEKTSSCVTGQAVDKGDAEGAPRQGVRESSTAVKKQSTPPKPKVTSPSVDGEAQPKDEPQTSQGGACEGISEAKQPTTPSIFPPCLKLTPAASHNPPLPTPPSSQQHFPSAATVSIPQKSDKLTDLYHTYLDATGFNHDLILLRTNPFLNNFAKYDLRLYESNTKPHVYCTFIRYTPPGGNAVSASTIPITPDQLRSQSAKEEPASENTSASTAQYKGARLQGLITDPAPGANKPLKRLLCPQNSPFSTAFLTFRHAFRDLTLLTWEERLDTLYTSSAPNTSSIQRLRAQAFQIEPFIWANKPKLGMPVGLVPAIPLKGLDTAYIRNKWELPGVDEMLGKEGSIGSALAREAEEAARREEEERTRAALEEKRRKQGSAASRDMTAEAGCKRADWKKPLFNAVNGRPGSEAPQWCRRGSSSRASSVSGSTVSAPSGASRPAVFTHFEQARRERRFGFEE